MPIEFESELTLLIEAGDLWLTSNGQWIQVMWHTEKSVALYPDTIISHDEFHDIVCTCIYIGQTDTPEDAGCYAIREDYDVGVS